MRLGKKPEQAVLDQLRDDKPAADDGWAWLYRITAFLAPPHTTRRRILCSYFRPSRIELARRSLLFRVLGVHRFGRVIPTGGVEIRRATKARMKPYTLAANTRRAARDFYYRACVFEALHLPFFLALAALAMHRWSIGRVDFAIQETVMNLAVNLYPMMHHRHTRSRIVRLLTKAEPAGV